MKAAVTAELQYGSNEDEVIDLYYLVIKKRKMIKLIFDKGSWRSVLDKP